MEDNAKNVQKVNRTIDRIPLNERQSALSISLIWMGGVVCIPVLAMGAIFIQQISFSTLVLYSFIGFSIQTILMVLNGISGSDQGLPLSILLTKGFGETGARYVGSLIIAVNVTGSYALQTTFCAAAFISMLKVWSINFPMWLSIIIWGYIMLYTAIRGFSGLKILNYIAMPMLLVVTIYATAISLVKYGGASAIFSHQPPIVPGVHMQILATMIGLMAGASVIVADITRYAKSRSATTIGILTGFLPTAVVFIAFGAIMGLSAGSTDIAQVFVGLKMPFFGLIAVIFATWTTNVTNGYSAGIALSRLMGLKQDKIWIGTLIAGTAGIIISLAGINISVWYNFMSTITPPIAGVMIADYWIDGKGKPENWGVRFGINWSGIIAAICGAAVGLAFPNFLNKSINSIVIALIAYVILSKILKKSTPELQPYD